MRKWLSRKSVWRIAAREENGKHSTTATFSQNLIKWKLKANSENQILSLLFSPNLQWNDNSPSEGSSCHSAQTFRFRWKARCPNRTARPLSEQSSTGRQMTACVAFFTALEKQTDFLKCSRQLFCGVRKYLFLAESSATSRWPVRIPVLPDHPQQRSKTVLNDRSSTKKNRCPVW